jgi:hypothetical protein
MKDIYTIAVKYTTQNEEGIMKRVSETYMTSGINFTDAESKMHSHIPNTELVITSIKRENTIHDVILNDTDFKYFKLALSYMSVDNKPVKLNYIVEAKDIDTASEILSKDWDNAGYKFEITSISAANICEVFNFEVPNVFPTDETDESEEENDKLEYEK